ncbi:alpha/beta fold hydrolase [Actinosynnema sp. NPDC020468]|uniref:alpha/beta fold hydrolase n=1 Tax=Actinosynnema sp. NPDC020468 TaxID=3154488 RepID=UPI0033D33965
MTRIPGLALTEHRLTVPLDHHDPARGEIEVFAREVVDPARVEDDLPWLLYLQGGPGGQSPRPVDRGGWLGRALRTHRVLLLDQRGTGRSTPVTARVAARADGEYLACFRADSIVADAEAFRRALLGDRQWETLGQSYGGFVTLTYLSRAPEALRACYVTGGLPGLDVTADDVYTRAYPRVRDKVAGYYARYPEDEESVRRIAERVDAEEVLLPDGDRLTSDRLRSLGFALGQGSGAERVHWVLEQAFDGPELSDAFRYRVMAATGFVDRPLYAVLQESIYGQGAPTRWAAQRTRPDGGDPARFTGEMVYPWMFEEQGALRPFARAAHELAERSWAPLYDLDRLARNEVPVAAAVYHDDMYVDTGHSLDTARRVGSVRAWVTNEWEHDGVNASGGKVLSRLMDLAAGRA